MTTINDNLDSKISEFTVRRLSNYYRILRDLESRGIATVSSAKLAELGGITSAQVRKDLSYFGNFGTRGLGYKVADLKATVERLLGLHKSWSVALFGAGFLGHALFFHQGFRDDGFYFKHVFDIAADKVGSSWDNLTIQPLNQAEEILRREPVEIGVLAVPKEPAQELATLLVGAGVRGILNFAPVQLSVPEDVWVRYVDLAVALESLSFYLSQ